MIPLDPTQQEYLNQSSNYLEQGNPERAAEYAEKLYQLAPSHPDTLLLLAELNFSIKNHAVAVEILEQAANVHPTVDKLLERLGFGYIVLERYSDAESSLQKAVALAPNNITAQLFLATVMEKLGEKEKAVSIYEKYANSFNSAEIFTHLGAYYYEHNIALSEKYYRSALQLNNKETTIKIDLAAVIYVRLTTQRDLSPGDYKSLMGDARKLLKKAKQELVDLEPEYQKRLLITLSNIQGLCGSVEDSIQSLRDLERMQGPNAEMINNLALRYLLIGNFREGYSLYSKAKELSRQDLGLQSKFNSGCESPVWQKEPLKGKCLLVTSEQGVGDQILHWSCLLNKEFKDAKIVLTCNEKLVPIVERSFPEFKVFSDTTRLSGQLIESIDYQISVADLCLTLHKSFDSVRPLSSYLKVDTNKAESFRQKYKELAGERLIIGVSWDSFAPNGALKSIPLESLKPLLKNKSYCFVSVQYSSDNEALMQWCQKNNIDLIIDEVDSFNDIDTAASQLFAMDCIVSISNASVHLASAIGKPVHLLLPTKPIWHWFIEGDRSIWYENLRIYRQVSLGDWKPAVKQVLKELKNMFKS